MTETENRSVRWANEWLAFYDGDQQIAGFATPVPNEYEELQLDWRSGRISWNKLVNEIKQICEG